jgi:hypothetical protein
MKRSMTTDDRIERGKKLCRMHGMHPMTIQFLDEVLSTSSWDDVLELFRCPPAGVPWYQWDSRYRMVAQRALRDRRGDVLETMSSSGGLNMYVVVSGALIQCTAQDMSWVKSLPWFDADDFLRSTVADDGFGNIDGHTCDLMSALGAHMCCIEAQELLVEQLRAEDREGKLGAMQGLTWLMTRGLIR